jgi:hypothetical protein
LLIYKSIYLVHLQTGFEYGFVAGAGYGYKFKTQMPLFLNAEYSFPAGETLTDDFKTRIGGQIRLLEAGGFSVAAKAYGIFRRFENTQAALVNFGSEFSGLAGYYRPKWFVAGEFGFKGLGSNPNQIAAHKKQSRPVFLLGNAATSIIWNPHEGFKVIDKLFAGCGIRALKNTNRPPRATLRPRCGGLFLHSRADTL